MKRKSNPSLVASIGIMILVLISTASFFIYFTIRQGIIDIFNHFNITNYYLQSLIAISLILILIFILYSLVHKKVNVGKTLKDMLKT